MARPCKCRRIGCDPGASYFKPGGVPVRKLREVILTLDELEAVRLSDLEGMYQQQAAARMNVSRQTFGNIVTAAHRKIADALLNAKALKIDGGTYERAETKSFKCNRCNHVWKTARGTARPDGCPHCKCAEIHSHACSGARAKKTLAKSDKAKCRRS